MIISNTQIQNALKTYAKQSIDTSEGRRVGKAAGVTKTAGSDRILMSEVAQIFQVAKQVINNTPEVRSEKTESLKEAVKTGTYSVTDGEIAEKLLGRSIIDIIVE